jgi:predicted lipoprotein with Yx(FWY)xxD motif
MQILPVSIFTSKESIMRITSQTATSTSGTFTSFSSKVRATCAAAALMVLAAAASAEPVTYTFQMNLDGMSATLDGVAVGGPLTITAKGDTNDMQASEDHSLPSIPSYSKWIRNMTTTFNLGGLVFQGLASFAVDSYDHSTNGYSALSFGFADNGYISIGSGDNVNPIYTLDQGAAGPIDYVAVNDNDGYIDWTDVATTAGLFSMDSTRNKRLDITFNAAMGDPNSNNVPEPASLSLFGLAGLGLLATRRRMQARQADQAA